MHQSWLLYEASCKKTKKTEIMALNHWPCTIILALAVYAEIFLLLALVHKDTFMNGDNLNGALILQGTNFCFSCFHMLYFDHVNLNCKILEEIRLPETFGNTWVLQPQLLQALLLCQKVHNWEEEMKGKKLQLSVLL